MIKLTNIKIPAAAFANSKSSTQAILTDRVAKILSIPSSAISAVSILRRSVDARRKGDVCFVFTLAVELDGENKILQSHADIALPYQPPQQYAFPYQHVTCDSRPLVVGMGPAGLFAALCLAHAGLKPIIIERGQSVEKRVEDVQRFWTSGTLDDKSNVLFGEGGAGTFSDGKLTTGINDERIDFVLQELVRHGAPEDILYLQKPHVGTDRLRSVVSALRQNLLSLGCDIRFGHKLDALHFTNGSLSGADISEDNGQYHLDVSHMILAPGNSARDTFEMLSNSGVSLSAKSFSVGVRIEHRQKDIDMAQYGQAATLGTLPASDYKLAVHLDSGRSVYTFCVCPGGSVIASSSESGQVVTNGMSEYRRDGKNCNGGLLVSVTPEDFPGSPIAGIEFQRELERSAFVHGGSRYNAPAQRVGDFLEKKPSIAGGKLKPTYKPGVTWCNLWDVLPDFICQAIAEALPKFEKSVRGFASPDAVLTAVETRSSCPIRIDRENYEAVGNKGLFPCGEGAGYAGGITSAAVDGIRAAEALCAALFSGN